MSHTEKLTESFGSLFNSALDTALSEREIKARGKAIDEVIKVLEIELLTAELGHEISEQLCIAQCINTIKEKLQ